MTESGAWEPLFRYIFAEFYKAVSNRDFIYIEPNILIYPDMCPTYFILGVQHVEPLQSRSEQIKPTIDSHYEQAKAQLQQYAKDKKAPADAIKIIAITTNDKLIKLEVIE